MNPEAKWLAWGYAIERVATDVIEHVKEGRIGQGTRALFAEWSLDGDTEVRAIRTVFLDHVVLRPDYLSMTVFLNGFCEAKIPFHFEDQILCRYIEFKD